MMTNLINLVMIDDHRMFLAGLKEIFDNCNFIHVVGEANSGEQGLEIIEQTCPDLVILDMTMPGMGGVECARQITQRFPSINVLALSMHNDLRFISEILRIGAKGYLLKDCPPEELLLAIKTIHNGHLYLATPVTELILEDYLRLRHLVHNGLKSTSPLSDRERTVLKLLAEGYPSKAVADRLNISKSTVDTHRRRMMDKLGCNSLAELIRHALKEKVIELD